VATIPKLFGTGGSGVPPAGSSEPTLKDILWDEADDLETLRTKYNALLTKIDLEGTLAGNYVSTLEMASGDLKTKKGT
jgi:hypothetical protein